MKIAFITADGKTVSKHFGRAPYYLVITVEDGRVVSQEMRDKISHTHFVNSPGESIHMHALRNPISAPGTARRNRVSEEKGPHQHGTSPEHQARHDQMAGVIDDCETLLCGGMGMGAYNALTGRGIKTLLTDIDSIDEALQTYLAGKLVDRAAELLH